MRNSVFGCLEIIKYVISNIVTAVKGRVSDPKIVGGEDARIQDFPYQVSESLINLLLLLLYQHHHHHHLHLHHQFTEHTYLHNYVIIILFNNKNVRNYSFLSFLPSFSLRLTIIDFIWRKGTPFQKMTTLTAFKTVYKLGFTWGFLNFWANVRRSVDSFHTTSILI